MYYKDVVELGIEKGEEKGERKGGEKGEGHLALEGNMNENLDILQNEFILGT